ncbi:hypothetical protein NOF04DRAFT_21826 [Fusarium oxysporum II5]|uniref:Uncharacterized protein n=1 Tax=Fusarium odoratissimum (strain NRRL 54006) TaxID=1089451 RepID=X0KZU5_FUSO5|nr:uncharacterized protein FOIG_06514 [Fusarium odoratissimum NRRL 54006]EXM02240.1 hypothetical protein FOIG_06514 [Fusarium odoratissimum NRRL 54006]KAK2133736.1 hypothetical protein NOF04DRAFT_21826 [Fusarium oxysporum II5]
MAPALRMRTSILPEKLIITLTIFIIDSPLRKFHWNFVVDEEEEWRACSVKRKREMEEEEGEEKKKKEKKPRLFFRRWSAPLAPVLSAVPAVVAPATTKSRTYDERAVAVLASVQKKLSARRKRDKKPKPKPKGHSILEEMVMEML